MMFAAVLDWIVPCPGNVDGEVLVPQRFDLVQALDFAFAFGLDEKV